MGFITGLICVALFFVVVYMVLLYLFYGVGLMLLFTIPTALCVLMFFLVKTITPSSYERMSRKVLADAARKDAEEVKERYEAVKTRVLSRTEENNTKMKELREQFDRTNMYIDSCTVIPKYYKNAEMVSVIETLIGSGRADSVKQAINLYEKEKMTLEVLDMESRAAKADSVEEAKKKAFIMANESLRDQAYVHESKMRENEKIRQELQLENDLLTDELERGQKINKYRK